MPTRVPKNSFEEILIAIEACLSNLAILDDKEDVDVKADDRNGSELGKLSENDEPGWVMGTLSKEVPQSMETYLVMEIWHDELTQLRWWDMADYFPYRDMKCWMAALKLLPIVISLADKVAATPGTTKFVKLIVTVDNVPGKSQMLDGHPHQGCSHTMLGFPKPQSDKQIMSRLPDAASNLLSIKQLKPSETHQCLPLHIDSLANNYKGIRFRR